MKPLYTTIKVTEKTKTSNLPIMDQIKLLFGKISNDEIIKLETSEKLNRAHLEMQSSLSNLIDTVTARMKELGEHSVTLSVSSKFKPYFESVLGPDAKGKFYTFEIEDKEVPVNNSHYFIVVTIREKEVYDGI